MVKKYILYIIKACYLLLIFVDNIAEMYYIFTIVSFLLSSILCIDRYLIPIFVQNLCKFVQLNWILLVNRVIQFLKSKI